MGRCFIPSFHISDILSVKLQPTGRQIDYGMSYSVNIDETSSVKLKGIYVQQPGHVQSEKDFLSGFLGYGHTEHRIGIGANTRGNKFNPRVSYDWNSNFSSKQGAIYFGFNLDPANQSYNSTFKYELKF